MVKILVNVTVLLLYEVLFVSKLYLKIKVKYLKLICGYLIYDLGIYYMPWVFIKSLGYLLYTRVFIKSLGYLLNDLGIYYIPRVFIK